MTVELEAQGSAKIDTLFFKINYKIMI